HRDHLVGARNDGLNDLVSLSDLRNRSHGHGLAYRFGLGGATLPLSPAFGAPLGGSSSWSSSSPSGAPGRRATSNGSSSAPKAERILSAARSASSSICSSSASTSSMPNIVETEATAVFCEITCFWPVIVASACEASCRSFHVGGKYGG